MGLDYYSRIQCAIQQPRDDEDFIERAKIGVFKKQMEELIEREKENPGREKSPQIMTFPFPVKTLLGARTQMSFSEISETWERIERKSMPLCHDCPVNLKGEALGCWSAISYPISQAAEHWLIEQFDSPSPGPSYLQHHIKSSGTDGRRLDEARAELVMTSEGARIPLLLPPGPAEKWVNGERVTSSMIIEYLLNCQPHLLPITLFGILDELRAIEETDDMTKMMLRMALGIGRGQMQPPLDSIRFKLPHSPGDDRSIFQFKQFLRACFLALRQNASMRIDG